jgi:hypothetical protein
MLDQIQTYRSDEAAGGGGRLGKAWQGLSQGQLLGGGVARQGIEHRLGALGLLSSKPRQLDPGKGAFASSDGLVSGPPRKPR